LLARGNILLPNNGLIAHSASNSNLTIENSTEVQNILAGGWLNINNVGAALQAGYPRSSSFNPAIGHFEITTLPQFDMTSGYDGSSGKPKFDELNLGINKPSEYTADMITVVPHLEFGIPTVTLTPDDSFDAYAYKNLANYAFFIDSNDFMKVSVKRITGLAEGEYFIGKYDNNRDDLCRSVTGTPAESSYGLNAAQFCTPTTQWNSDVNGGIANFATMASSTQGSSYQGGDINFANSSEIFGSVWAGNLYGNTGDTKIHGYITALALGNKSSGNTIKNSTKIILTDLPWSFNAGQTASTPGTSGEGTAPSVITRWVRYQ
jgi:hypothetical protein